MREKSKIKKPAQLALSLILALSFPQGLLTAVEGIKDEERVVDGMQKSYESAVDFAADFRQETQLKTLNRTLKAWGKVYFKRPGRMLWRYEEPKGEWVLADGNSLYYYQPEQAQILKTPLKNAFRSDVPLSFLLGIGNLKRDFRVTVKGLEQEHYVVQLAPKGESGGVDEVLLGVERQAFGIAWARIRDQAGNVTTVRFSNIKRGVGLKDSVFNLQVPDGVDIVEMGSK